MQSYIEVDKGLCTLKINWKEKRTVGKANKGINVEKIIIGLKIFFKKEGGREKRKGKVPRIAKAQPQRQGFMTMIENVTENKREKSSKV